MCVYIYIYIGKNTVFYHMYHIWMLWHHFLYRIPFVPMSRKIWYRTSDAPCFSKFWYSC